MRHTLVRWYGSWHRCVQWYFFINHLWWTDSIMCWPLKERYTTAFCANDFRGTFSMSTIIYFLISASNCCCHCVKQWKKLAMPLTHIVTKGRFTIWCWRCKHYERREHCGRMHFFSIQFLMSNFLTIWLVEHWQNAGEVMFKLNLSQLEHHPNTHDAMLVSVSYCEPTEQSRNYFIVILCKSEFGQMSQIMCNWIHVITQLIQYTD